VIAADLGAKFPGAMLDLSALVNSLLIAKAKEIEAGTSRNETALAGSRRPGAVL